MRDSTDWPHSADVRHGSMAGALRSTPMLCLVPSAPWAMEKTRSGDTRGESLRHGYTVRCRRTNWVGETLLGSTNPVVISELLFL